MEDGVAFDKKKEARRNICDFLHSWRNCTEKNKMENIRFGLRINNSRTDLFYEDVHATLIPCMDFLSTIVIPKVEDVNADLLPFFTDIKNFGARQNDLSVFPCIESAKGLLNIQSIVSFQPQISQESNCNISGLIVKIYSFN